MLTRYVSGRLNKALLPVITGAVDIGHDESRFNSIYLNELINIAGSQIGTNNSGQLVLNSPSGNITVTSNLATFLGRVEVTPNNTLVTSGSTAERPASPITGSLYINLQKQVVEFYNGDGSWIEGSANISILSIDTLADVNTSNEAPISGQALIWNSQVEKWIPGTPSIASLGIDALGDVDTTANVPLDGQALVWSSVSSKWMPGNVALGSGGGGSSFSLTGDLDFGTFATPSGMTLDAGTF